MSIIKNYQQCKELKDKVKSEVFAATLITMMSFMVIFGVSIFAINYLSVDFKKSLVVDTSDSSQRLNSIKIDSLGLRNGEWIQIVCYKENAYTSSCDGMKIYYDIYFNQDLQLLTEIKKVNYNFITNTKYDLYSSTQVGIKPFRKLDEKVFSDENNPKIIFWKIQTLSEEDLKNI